MNRRTREIKLRLTEEEHEKLLKLADGRQLARWLRETALKVPERRRRKPVPDADPVLLRELAGIGNNVNQIARTCNRLLQTGQGHMLDVAALAVALQRIEEQLQDIKRGSSNDR